MNIETNKQVGSVTFVVAGELAGESCAAFRDTVLANVTLDTGMVYVDLTHVPYIDSLGLGALVGIKVTCNRNGAKIALVAPSPEVLRVLLAVRFDQVFQMVEAVGA